MPLRMNASNDVRQRAPMRMSAVSRVWNAAEPSLRPTLGAQERLIVTLIAAENIFGAN